MNRSLMQASEYLSDLSQIIALLDHVRIQGFGILNEGGYFPALNGVDKQK